jgi:hypothetical protein
MVPSIGIQTNERRQEVIDNQGGTFKELIYYPSMVSNNACSIENAYVILHPVFTPDFFP